MVLQYRKGDRKAFCFLCDNGFTMTAYFVNSEIDVYYGGKRTEITVTSFWEMDENYKSRQMIEAPSTADGGRENLLRMEKLFGADALAALESPLRGRSIREKVETYAEFIKEHFCKLL